MDISYIQLTPQDAALWTRTAQYAAACSWQPTGRFLADKMLRGDFLDRERVFTAMEGDRIVGFCAFTEESAVLGRKFTPYLGFVFVDENRRGLHIGQGLCRAALRYARSQGYGEVHLYTDLTGYYERQGFVKTGEEPAPWGERMSVYTFDTTKI